MHYTPIKLEKKLFYLSSIIITFAITYYVYPLYYAGDLLHYNNYYYSVAQYNIKEAFSFYRASLGTQEPVYFLTTYFSSIYINKIYYSIIVNIIISILAIRLILIHHIKVSKIFFLIAFFSCVYTLVLFIPADRLKLSLLFFLVGFNIKSPYARYIWFTISFLTHVQILLLLLAEFSYNYLGKTIKTFKIKKTTLWLLIFGSIAIIIAVVILFEHIFLKYEAYTKSPRNIAEILLSSSKVAIFMLLTLMISNTKKVETILIYTPFFLFSLIVGESRIIIFCFYIFACFLLKKRSNIKYLIYTPFLIYYAISSYNFIRNVYLYGNGFPIL